MKKKIYAFLLSVAMVLSSADLTVLAAEVPVGMNETTEDTEVMRKEGSAELPETEHETTIADVVSPTETGISDETEEVEESAADSTEETEPEGETHVVETEEETIGETEASSENESVGGSEETTEAETVTTIDEKCYVSSSEEYFTDVFVENADDLFKISNDVAQGISDYDRVCIQIKNDIDLSGVTWSPIGKSSEHPFRGSIQGNGHTITGMQCGEERSALIGYWDITDECRIEKLNIRDMQLSGDFSGGIVADSNVCNSGKGIISDCNVEGDITCLYVAAGVISRVGVNQSGNIEIIGCDINVSMFSKGTVGGIVGEACDDGTGKILLEDCAVGNTLFSKQTYGYCRGQAGGLIGLSRMNSVKIERCSKIGSVSCQAYWAYTGGIIGNAGIDGDSSMEINNSYVNAEISPICTNGSSQGGGVIGYTEGKGGSQISISNTYVTGSISASNKAAFVCWHSGDECPIIKNCYFDMNKLELAKDSMVCKLALFSTTWLDNNIFNSSGLTTEEMKLQSSFTGWKFGIIWEISEENDGYPILIRGDVKRVDYESKVDETIINAVERYTSGKEVQEVTDIFKNSKSDEEIRQRLFEYYNYDNMLDVRERIIELGSMHDERWDYEGLIRDDMYLSWQYYDYLNNTTKGAAARVALYASGLVFNSEINEWIDPATYMDSDLPGIKKYKSLLEEFIQKESSSIEWYTYIKETESFVNSAVGVWSKAEKAEVIKQLDEAQDKVSCKTIFNNFVARKVGDGDKTLTFVFEGEIPVFIEAMELTDTIFKISNASMDTVTGLMDVSSNLETYKVYHGFLKEIYESDDLPWELVVAAYQVDRELGQAYWTPIKGILNEIRDACMKQAFDAVEFENLLNKNGWLAAINFSAFCINQFVDIGALVVNSCHTEGYAFLAMHYKNKLEQCKQQFLTNKTEENAWTFYETYVMLWKLRIAGEQKFLQMSNLEGGEVVDGLSEVVTGGTIAGMISELCGYSDKEAAIKANLKMLEGFKFKYTIRDEDLPDEYKYLQKIVVECPVSVEILTADGTQVCLLDNKTETQITNDYGMFVSFYRATTGDYVKIAYLKNNEPYRIRAVGKEDGKVSYSLAKTQDHQTYTLEGFQDVPISENSVITLQTDKIQYEVDSDGDGKTDIVAEQANKKQIFVQFDYQDNEHISVIYTGEDGKVTFPEIPIRSGYEFLGWYTEPGDQGEIFDKTTVSASVTVYAHWKGENIVSPPEADISSGSQVKKGSVVALSSKEEGVQIYYTLDETIPTKESILYDKPIEILKDTTIKAFAAKEGFKDSEVVTFSYTVTDTGKEPDEDEDNDDESEETGDGILPEDMPAGGIEAIPDGLWIAGIEENGYTYTGKQIKPSVRVYDKNRRLKAGRDYTITYKNNTKANDASNEKTAPSIIVKGKGNYAGKETATFKIVPMDLDSAEILTGDIVAAYNKKLQKKVPTLTYNGKKLANKKDFTVSYPALEQGVKDAYKAPGTYDVLLTAKADGNFTGTRTVKLTITESTLISKASIKKIPTQTYTGTAIEPELTVAMKKQPLVKGIDYTVQYENNTEIGTATVIVTGIGKFAGSRKVTFKITGESLKKAVVTGLENKIYNGKEQTQNLSVSLDGKVLEEGTDYEVTYAKSKEAGTASVTIKGIHGYTGTLKHTFKIAAYDIKADTEKKLSGWEGELQVKYMKGGCKPKLSISFDGTPLVEGTDYSISYKNNKAVTTDKTKNLPTITVKGKGSFKGTLTKNFTIIPKALDDEQVPVTITAADIGFVDKAGKYASKPILTDADGKVLKAGTDYEKAVVYTLEDGTVLSNKSKVNAETNVKVTVTGKGAYSGTLETVYRITKSDFKKAKISIAPKIYTGNAVTLEESDITVKAGGTKLVYGQDYEIAAGSYSNNKEKGTATVTIVGKGNYGGTKKVKFKITAKQFSWFWRIFG